jgi:cytochrome c-type biogenesis protein CcmH/NrfG
MSERRPPKEARSTAVPPHFSSRLILAAVILGLAAMLAAALAYRLGDHPLIHVSRTAPQPEERGPDQPAFSGNVPDVRQQTTLSAMQRLQANPDDVDTLLELTELFMAQDNPEAARNFADRALVSSPSDSRPSYYLGILAAKSRDYAQAAEFLERSVGLQDAPEARYSLAVIYKYHLNEPAKADLHLQAGLRHPALTPELRTLLEAEL